MPLPTHARGVYAAQVPETLPLPPHPVYADAPALKIGVSYTDLKRRASQNGQTLLAQHPEPTGGQVTRFETFMHHALDMYRLPPSPAGTEYFANPGGAALDAFTRIGAHYLAHESAYGAPHTPDRAARRQWAHLTAGPLGFRSVTAAQALFSADVPDEGGVDAVLTAAFGRSAHPHEPWLTAPDIQARALLAAHHGAPFALRYHALHLLGHLPYRLHRRSGPPAPATHWNETHPGALELLRRASAQGDVIATGVLGCAELEQGRPEEAGKLLRQFTLKALPSLTVSTRRPGQPWMGKRTHRVVKDNNNTDLTLDVLAHYAFALGEGWLRHDAHDPFAGRGTQLSAWWQDLSAPCGGWLTPTLDPAAQHDRRRLRQLAALHVLSR